MAHTVDDTDDVDVEGEEMAWKVRELSRLKRDRQARRTAHEEEVEVERRRALTNAEILAEDADRQSTGVKDKITFMQRYYHKGAFVMSEEVEAALAERNFAEPTGEDRFDKSALPEVMQGEGRACGRVVCHVCVDFHSPCSLSTSTHARPPLPPLISHPHTHSHTHSHTHTHTHAWGAVKRFGFSSRTKYKHLKDEDTTDLTAGYVAAASAGSRRGGRGG